MRKLLNLQIKRVLKIFPFVCLVTLILFICLAVILSVTADKLVNSEEFKKFNIALTGDTDSEYIDLGLTVMRTMDSSRFSIEFIEMSETEAQKALSKGEISAYVVLPPKFIENALNGKNETIKYVTSPGGGGVITLFKNEITDLVTQIVVNSQKGTYGIYDAAVDAGLKSKVNRYVDKISLEYVEMIFNRSEIYEVEELGIKGGLSMVEALCCGLVVLFITLMGIPYIVIFARRDRAFSKLLKARGISVFSQIFCESTANLFAMILMLTVLFGTIGTVAVILNYITFKKLVMIYLLLLPVILMISEFNIMIFEISDSAQSGVLLHFFTGLALCYISGCMYPTSSLPVLVQNISVALPTGLCKDWISVCFTDEYLYNCLWGIIVYTVLFFAVTYIVRNRKIKYIQG